MGAPKDLVMSLRVELKIKDQAMVDRLQRLGDKFNRTMRVGAQSAIGMVIAHVIKTKLLGQVLNRRTGTLIRSVSASGKDEVTDTGAQGTFGTNLDYGLAHEYGFSGMVTRGAHTRKAHQRRAHQRIVGGEVQEIAVQQVRAHAVREHQARLEIKELRYQRDSVKEKTSEILARFVKAASILLQDDEVPNVNQLSGTIN